MEDFGNILWILLIGASLIYSATGKKARKKRSSRPADPPQWQGEAWPVLGPAIDPGSDSRERQLGPDSDGEWRRIGPDPNGRARRFGPDPNGRARRFGPAPQPEKPQKHPRESFETRMGGDNGLPARRSRKQASVAALATDESPQTAQHQTDAVAKARSGNNRSKKRTAPENSGQKIVSEEFDLKRAIIYSELLKPKFDD